MSWLSNTFGDRFSLFSVSFVVRNSARIAVVFAALFAALPAKPQSDAANHPSAAETLVRWIQPSVAEAAPRRQRVRGTRAQAKKSDVASETSAEQSAPMLAPLTPYIQIWPLAHTVKSDAPEAMAHLPSNDFMPVAGKGDRLTVLAANEENVVDADELSELDRAAAPSLEIHPDGLVEPRAQPVAFTTTDGRAAHDISDTAVPVNRFSAFAESVKAIPQAPWFDSVMIVMAGVLTAFFAARFFMRA